MEVEIEVSSAMAEGFQTCVCKGAVRSILIMQDTNTPEASIWGLDGGVIHDLKSRVEWVWVCYWTPRRPPGKVTSHMFSVMTPNGGTIFRLERQCRRRRQAGGTLLGSWVTGF